MTLLLVFGGLPGSGKTAVSRAVADALEAVWIRLDTIEAALARSGRPVGDVPAGYAVAHALATDQLRLGRTVVVDAVNPVRAARAGWEECAAGSGGTLRFVEVRCSDVAEHRRRVETRRQDIPGHRLPTWDDVCALEYEQWAEQRLVVDNDGTVAQAARRVTGWLARGAAAR